MNWTHSLIKKINGTVVSRHTSYENAIKVLREWDEPQRDPLRMAEYKENYYQEMKST